MKGSARLRLYRGLGRVLVPALHLWLRARARRGKEDAARRGERFGRASLARPEGPLVWFHAASVGELHCILPLATRVRALGLHVLVTTGTVTSAVLAKERLPAGALHQFQALDVAPAVRRFLDHWAPDLAVFVESEVWPTTIGELAARGVPLALVNARMSDRSFRSWAKRPRLARGVFGRFSHVIAQGPMDAERFRVLGAPRVAAAGNLKIDTAPPPVDADELAALRERIGARPVWTAASLHPGEAAVVAEAARRLRERRPDALLVAVPRHPDRADDFAAAFAQEGLCVARRSRGEEVGADTAVLLADTMGELGLWFRLAPVAFMGKSLLERDGGGQNPVEAVLCGAAVLSGRSVANFRDAYRALLLARGARLVRDAPQLADYVAHLWSRTDDAAAMREGAEAAVKGLAGALDRTLQQLDPWIAPLRMEAMLRRTRAVSEGHVAGLSAARLKTMRRLEIGGRDALRRDAPPAKARAKTKERPAAAE